jgi:hypothetical protein
MMLAASALASTGGLNNNYRLYFPMARSAPCGGAPLPRINAPGFGANPIPFGQTAIAWFGTLSPDSNYADVRVGYNNQHLYVYLAILDRHLWYDANPAPATLTQWDAVTLLLDTAGGNALSAASWRFVAQLYGDPEPRAPRGLSREWQRLAGDQRFLPGRPRLARQRAERQRRHRSRLGDGLHHPVQQPGAGRPAAARHPMAHRAALA